MSNNPHINKEQGSYRQQLSQLVRNDPFWGNNLSILYNSNRVVEFVPTKDMSRVERLNALSRLSIYAGVLLSIIYGDVLFLFVGVIGMALFYFINMHFPEENQLGGADSSDPRLMTPQQDCKDCDRDENGNLYQKPTQDNPFMNVLLTDYADHPNRPPAGDIEDPKILNQAKKHFGHGLYKDVDDIWDRNNSQRQYYSNPATTIPNDRDSFMKWCWNTPYVCKDGDKQACLRYEDVRGHGQIT